MLRQPSEQQLALESRIDSLRELWKGEPNQEEKSLIWNDLRALELQYQNKYHQCYPIYDKNRKEVETQ